MRRRANCSRDHRLGGRPFPVVFLAPSETDPHAGFPPSPGRLERFGLQPGDKDDRRGVLVGRNDLRFLEPATGIEPATC